jgi:hypothetical protein
MHEHDLREYLGDGLYVEVISREEFRLYTSPAFDKRIDEVFLDRLMLKKLIEVLARIDAEHNTVETPPDPAPDTQGRADDGWQALVQAMIDERTATLERQLAEAREVIRPFAEIQDDIIERELRAREWLKANGGENG